MLSIEMLKAERGDAILIEYGPAKDPTNRVLIDGGPRNSKLYKGIRKRLLDIDADNNGQRRFDLLVISHIDADHIEGTIALLQDPELGCVFDDIWFNGWQHIEHLDAAAKVTSLGAAQGEYLGALLGKQSRPWNTQFDGKAVMIPNAPEPLPVVHLPGGMKLTLLSPSAKELAKLARRWKKELKDLDFNPGESDKALAQLEDKWWAREPVALGSDDRVMTSRDKSAANGSSIAFIASWQDRNLLLAADAYQDVLTTSLRRFRAHTDDPNQPVPIDAFKLSHHGSENNISRQLLQEMTCDAYLVSTSGHRFKHPDSGAIGTIIDHHQETAPGGTEPIVAFNYRQRKTLMWEDDEDIDARFEEDAKLVYDAE